MAFLGRTLTVGPEMPNAGYTCMSMIMIMWQLTPGLCDGLVSTAQEGYQNLLVSMIKCFIRTI
jgi:hypothetical protein